MLLKRRGLATCFDVQCFCSEWFCLFGNIGVIATFPLDVYCYNSANIVGKSLILVPLERPFNCLSDATNNSESYLATHSCFCWSGSHLSDLSTFIYRRLSIIELDGAFSLCASLRIFAHCCAVHCNNICFTFCLGGEVGRGWGDRNQNMFEL